MNLNVAKTNGAEIGRTTMSKLRKTYPQHSDCGYPRVLALALNRGSGAGDTATGWCLDQRL